MSLSLKLVLDVADQHGLDLVAFASSGSALRRLAVEQAHLEHWQEHGFAGDMGYMVRDSQLLTGLHHLLPNCRSLICFAVPYGRPDRTPLQSGCGRVARYAWGKDYHGVLKALLLRFEQSLRERIDSPFRARVFSDAVPLLERALSREAGLGFVGKNTMLIQPGIGSFVFLAEILLDVEVVDDRELKVESAALRVIRENNSAELGQGCGTCARCIADCPTQAIVQPGVIDARRCISYLTIEKRARFESWEEEAVGEWIFGCDVCQTVCPFNAGAEAGVPLAAEPRKHPQDSFSAEAGIGGQLRLEEVLKLSNDTDFKKRFADTPLLRPGRAGLTRNACCVAANTRSVELAPLLLERAESDPDANVRDQAIRSLKRLEPLLSGLESISVRKFLQGSV